ncbi:hypothetical protein B0A52_09002 [Exophiala mesophila]|uniref:NAD-dependent epimerase/dehydratase domain-containing protein n=1 Tax=Exophiala mesophila TaxID=212818 RepID=A0A438MT92_EXOME|nr:hypothetical protein B0A52_09002 [Exophiala mesophila]
MAQASRSLRSLPQDALMLVTGANGYIGSTVVNLLLVEGYRVRGTVRSEKPWLDRLFHDKYGSTRYETVVIPNLAAPGELEKALEGVWGVVHVASDLTLDPDRERVINGTIAHTTAILQAASNASTVESFVLTSSSTACLIPVPNKEGIVIDEDTWNEAAIAAAWDPNTSNEDLPYNIYAASKTEGEKALWKFVKEFKPRFAVNTVLPAANYGTILAPEITGSTMGWVRQLLFGNAEVFTNTPPQWFVNVEDCARLHVAALLDREVNHQRIFAFAETVNWTQAVNILRELRPDNANVPNPPPNEGKDLSVIKPRDKAEALLRRFWGVEGFKNLKESISDGIADL